jgi:ribosome-binding protein aMBF1 (putative translation factor)
MVCPSGKSFGDRLKAWRLKTGIMQKDLAKEIGRHRTTVQSWERGLWEPGEDEKKKVEKIMF